MNKKSWQNSVGLRAKSHYLQRAKKFSKRMMSKARRRYAKQFDTLNGFEQKSTGANDIV
jgi:hypothetical protein